MLFKYQLDKRVCRFSAYVAFNKATNGQTYNIKHEKEKKNFSGIQHQGDLNGLCLQVPGGVHRGMAGGQGETTGGQWPGGAGVPPLPSLAGPKH